MQLKFLERKEIDNQKWDFCIQNCINPLPYALSWYLDAVTGGRWAAIVGIENQTYVAVMPLPWAKKMFIRYLKQPLFCQQLGIFSLQKISEKSWVAFLRLAQGKFPYASRYHFHVGQENTIEKLEQKTDFHIFYTHLLDLTRSHAHLLRGYDADKRYHLRQATKKYKAQIFHVGSNLGAARLFELFKESTASKIAGGIAKDANLVFKRLYEALEKNTKIYDFYTYNRKEIEAGVLIFSWQQWHIYLFNAGKKEYRKNQGRLWLLDAFFQRESGSKTPSFFDFESAQDPEVAYFYEKFGAKKAAFWVWSYNKLPFYINWLWKVKKIIKGYTFRA
jgi:hypothetical protein